MDNSDKTALAAKIAAQAHKGQKDKAGRDYINHPLTVASYVSGEQEKCVALLHDVLEDSTMYTYQDLAEMFGEDIAASVRTLTHREGESYRDYIVRIKRSGDRRAIAVKKADLKHNSDLRRLGKAFFKKPARNARRWLKYQICRIYLTL